MIKRLLIIARISLCWFFFILLSACAALPTTEQAVNSPYSQVWQQRVAALEQLQNWSVQGRVAVSDAGQGWQATVSWQQQAEQYAINLIGPLGQGRVVIEGDEQSVSMTTARGVIRAADPESLLAQTTTQERVLPVSGLRYWIRGLPVPESHLTKQPTIDQQGRLLRLQQNGWVIEYPNYIQVEKVFLPQRIVAQQQDIKVKLILSQWTLN